MSKTKQKQIVWVIFGVFLFSLFLVPLNSQAAALHTLSDRISRHAPLTGVTHEFKFTTPSGAGEAGDYIRISFDGGFDLSPILYSDITLTHGPVTGLEKSETVAAAASATSWGFSKAENYINLIHPTNSANGDIAPNDVILINIGTVNKIINPAVIGSKVIVLYIYNSSNTIIDMGRLAVPIAQDQIGVSGAPLSTLPTPVILNFPYSVTSHSLDLDWSRNFDSNFDHYALYVGDSTGLNNITGTWLLTVFDPSMTIFTIDGLASSHSYYFVVYVYNTEGLSAASNEVHATTQSTGGINPPPPPPPPPPPDDEDEDEDEEPQLFEKVGDVTCEEGQCAYFSDSTILSGTRPLETYIYINHSTFGVEYPSDSTWRFFTLLNPGHNLFHIEAINSSGDIVESMDIDIKRYELGDSNGDGTVDDFDLSTLVAHFGEPWCFSDFNGDNIVDDFDLSVLASRWSM